ncbi:AraC family transcriptional regulator [Paenibacillus sp. ACRRX]|uniref:AraC family transcriptional regulator n=1 Tax=unclassified Paenibacillus TaxID=185978 RepID=UPI001EF50A6D|nr:MULTISPECIES: AraC family transcriptional regulator [unclassified Paenibacillus]MCG7405951.1 AraC family transcriptional regulator [Paenibacillus sp. ACRRX]MDK8182405.1 AraC family transcriptional regulator [Paenibacillus sp. UMB4589-SE434]
MDKPQAILRDDIEFPSSSFPLLTTSTEGVSPGFQRLHWHHALELNYIREGTGFYVINGLKIQFQAGDLILINSDDLHRAFEMDNLIMDIIMFDPSILAVDLRYDPELMRPFREMGTSFANLIGKDHPAAEDLQTLFIRMMDEGRREDISYITMIRSDLTRFLALVNRRLQLKDQKYSPMKHRGMHVLKEVIHMMEINLTYNWTLQELAEQAHLSPSRFSALFQQVVGTSPLNYLIQLRLTRAVHLLESSDEKIIDIAEQCGFRNLSNFNRLFKHHIGTSPSDVRSQITI